MAKPVAGRRVAVIGAGWAGCAAAVELAAAGAAVTLFESTRTLGGRARHVDLDGRALDNGQHILLGAYRETLQLMRRVGVKRDETLLTLPLQMRYPPDSGGMDFLAPRWPAPLHMAYALLCCKGLERADKMSLARFSSAARWMGWQLDNDCSVSELLERFDQTARLIGLMWRPLCLAALNTAPERASAKVFLAVLRDSLGARRAASDMLLPKVDLSALLPQAAGRFVQDHGGQLRTGCKVTALRPAASGKGWLLDSAAQPGPELFEGLVLATSPLQAASLLAPLASDHPGAAAAAGTIAAFEFEAISTCYLQYGPQLRLELPFYALRDDAASGNWGQFVFDRGQLHVSQAGLLAVVVSAAGQAAQLEQAGLAAAIAAQLAAVLHLPQLAAPAWSRVLTDKRATFACTPGLARPANETGCAGLVLAGDYTAGDYPATLEAAVRSGLQAARLLSAQLPAAS